MARGVESERDPFASSHAQQPSPIVESVPQEAGRGRDAFAGAAVERASSVSERDPFATRSEPSAGRDPFAGAASREGASITDRDPFSSRSQSGAGQDPFQGARSAEQDDDLEIGGAPNISREGIAAMMRSVDRTLGQEPRAVQGSRDRGDSGFER